MINKLISKSEVRLLEWDGIRSNDYADGFCDAIQKVIDLEPIPTLGVDEIEKIKAEIEDLSNLEWIDERTQKYTNWKGMQKKVLEIIDKHIGKAEKGGE